MHLRFVAAGFSAMLVFFAVAAALAIETGTDDDPVCSGRAPFREVAQDEIYTFDELCSLREDFRTDRERRGTVGWAKAPRAPTAHRATK